MIYFIQSEENGYIKIGYSQNANTLETRLSTLQIGNPHRLTLLKTIEGDIKYEKVLHLVFADDRILGEWFEPTTSLLNFLKIKKKATLLEIYRGSLHLAEEDVTLFTEKQITDMIKVKEEYGLTCYVFNL